MTTHLVYSDEKSKPFLILEKNDQNEIELTVSPPLQPIRDISLKPSNDNKVQQPNNKKSLPNKNKKKNKKYELSIYFKNKFDQFSNFYAVLLVENNNYKCLSNMIYSNNMLISIYV